MWGGGWLGKKRKKGHPMGICLNSGLILVTNMTGMSRCLPYNAGPSCSK